MNRRGMLWAAVSSLGGALLTRRADAATSVAATSDGVTGKLKVVYHLNDLDRVNFVLGNIENHFAGVGGPENVTLALVVHGPALRAFHRASASPDVVKRVGAAARAGLGLAACGNTMAAQNVGLADLLPGFVSADKGGVVRLAELQSQGYLYLKP